MKHLYNNMTILAQFILRRDRIRIPIWIISFVGITVAVAISFTDLYATSEARQAMAETVLNPAMTALIGPGYGVDNYTFGAMMAHQMLLLTAVVVGLMNILFVTRHTRTDEEGGRIELIRSLPSGRLANLGATFLVAFVMNVVLALLVGIGLYALRIESIDWEGSLLYGVVLGTVGIFSASITAIFAQLSESSRGALGFSFASLASLYLVRAIGDVSNEAVSWLSPLGWVLRSEVFVNNYWWPILLTIGMTAILIVISFYLNNIRDLEAGFLPAMAGRRNAHTMLLSPFGLIVRLQRVGIIAWAIGMYILGVSYGSVFADFDSFFEGNEMMQELLIAAEGFSLVEQFIPMLLTVMAIASTIPALLIILKLKGEENKRRVEPILAASISRPTLLGAYVILSVVVGIVVLALSVIGIWSAGAIVMEEGLEFNMILGGAMAYIPAMLVMVGVAVLLIGCLPRLAGFVWLYLGFSFFVVYLGGILQIPEWTSNLSPFGYIPQLPIDEMSYGAVSALTGIALFLVVIGLIGYRRRDVG